MSTETNNSAKEILRQAALTYHETPRPGKLEVRATKPLANGRDLSLAYSPGVAEACLEIKADPANAARYTAEDDRIVLRWYQDDSHGVLEVQDSGIGIEPQYIPRLTERFYRVDQSRSLDTGGTGLGLAIVKHVLLRHRAEMKISSQPGHGSTFSCLFPRSLITRVN